MVIAGTSLDDILHTALERLLKAKIRTNSSRKEAREIIGVELRLRNPRARLSQTAKKGKAFSCLGELLWYLSGSNRLSRIKYYIGQRYDENSDDGKTVYGAYGPRLFKMDGSIDQTKSILKLLQTRPDTRRAVIQLFSAQDILKHHADIPCTCTLQFLLRKRRLSVVAHMRSNDAFLGLPHDVFAFTMLQEMFARSLGADIGEYVHFVGSLHLYDRDRNDAEEFLREGWQRTTPMPGMPPGDPWPSIRVLLRAEATIRSGRPFDERHSRLEPYWLDLVRLLKVFANYKRRNARAIERVRARMHSTIYNLYIDEKHDAATRQAANVKPVQGELTL